MIRLTRLNGKAILVNAELIKFVESSPDTLISFTDGDRLNVRETPDQVAGAVVAYRRQINECKFDWASGGEHGETLPPTDTHK